MINWRSAQQRLGISPDGALGPVTMTALLAHVAQHPIDDVLRAIGTSAATVLPRYHISDTVARLAEFLGETACESGGYTRFEEDLFYSAQRLTRVWPGRFPTVASAAPYAGKPERLASLVYGGRMGNRPGTTDGWNYRGRGLLQHTGHDEYAQLQARLGLAPDDVAAPAHAVQAAADFWERRGVSAACDRGDWLGARRLVNGGTIGIDTVAAYRARALGILQEETTDGK